MKIVNEQEQPVPKKIDSKFELLNKNELPSRGHYYDTDIYIKKMSIRNITDLSTMNESNQNNVISKVLFDCVHGIETSKILLNDRNWLLFRLRYMTFKKPYKVKFSCPECMTTNWTEVTLSNLETYYFNENNKLEFEMPNKDKITIKYPTIGIDEQIRKKMNDPNIIGGINYVIMSIASHLDTVNGQKMGLMASYEYLDEGTPDNYETLVNFLMDNKFGCTGKVKYKCQCGTELLTDLTFNDKFFIPREEN